LRHGFIVAQIALAFVLVAGAALLGLSLKKVLAVPPGFRSDHVLSGECTLTWDLQKDRVAIVDRLLEAVRQQPGIAAVGATTSIPLSGDSGKTAVTPRGYVPPPGQTLRGHYSYGVSGDYFAALGIPLLEGRFLNAADSSRPERVCVVDEDFARRYWPNGGAPGQQVAHGGESDEAKLFTIVGVVGAVKQAELTEAPGQGAIYLPYAHRDNATVFVVVRTSQSPEAFAETLRRLVRETQPEVAIDNIRAMDARIADSLVARRSPALLAGIFASVALLLAAIGTYGVLSYAVAQRRREIGIRMALGAQREQVARQFLSLGLRLLAAGTVLGFIGAWLAGRAMQSILFAVPTLPVATLLGTALVMSVVSLVACLLPARRAAKVDPMIALRCE
jgi:predicted permease